MTVDHFTPTREIAKKVGTHTAYKHRLYPSPAAEGLMNRYAAAERAIYNRAVQHQRELRELAARRRQLGGRMGRPPIEPLTYQETKMWDPPELRETPARVRTHAVQIAERALLDSCRVEARKPPTFRRRHDATNGFGWQATCRAGDLRKINKRYHEVRLPVARGAAAVWCRVRVDADRQPPAGAYRCGKVLRITRDAVGTWWLTTTTPAPTKPAAPEGSSCGLDLGVVHTLTLADHTGRIRYLDSPQLLSEQQERRLKSLRRAQDRARRTIPCGCQACPHGAGKCWKTSTRYQERRREIAVLIRRQRRSAHDWIERVTTIIADRYQTVGVENLNVMAMTASAAGTVKAPGRNVAAKSGLNREILRQRWGTIIRRLEEKVVARGGRLVRVPAANTSRRCHQCDHSAAANRQTQAEFRCEACGHTDGADANAAHNIHQLALQGHPPACGGAAHERASAPTAATDVEVPSRAADEASITLAA